ncbi:CDP-glucose 4,6-dehydratase [bacterium]|jgi:CDP-glucose 4,6-dehydratase|nr:CDP-glucose 4,6-dehydratase [bacterium]MBT3795256.1 CDP-glucose 4,6-dehydratase [bacterium]MBT4634112.1 CDP-glucose 4,6-dehydratase [bacterium]
MNLKRFYSGKRVLVTGHTGFKGAWLSLILSEFGAEVHGISLKPEDTRGNFYNIIKLNRKINSNYINLVDYKKLEKSIEKIQPEIIFHLAAQPYVIRSYKNPIETIQSNVLGVSNLLNISRNIKTLKFFLNITTDKCYENDDSKRGFKETDSLGGKDIYSSSKACSELLTKSFHESFLKNNIAIGTARAGNVIGGGDFGEDRLIPDIFESIINKDRLIIRNPNSIRPWQYILDVLSGYLLQTAMLKKMGKKQVLSYNFAPVQKDVVTVQEIVRYIAKYFNYKDIKFLNKNKGFKESKNLLLNSRKAFNELGWKNKYKTLGAIDQTIKWNESYRSNPKDIQEFSISLIKDYFKI